MTDEQSLEAARDRMYQRNPFMPRGDDAKEIYDRMYQRTESDEDDNQWISEMQAWILKGYMLIWGNPRSVTFHEAIKMQIRANTLLRIAEDAISGEQG